MFKWVSWVIRMGATALLLSFLCIWTTGYIVNSYMESVIKQLDLPLETQPFALSGVWGKLWGADQPPNKAASASDNPSTDKKEAENSMQPDSRNEENPTETPINVDNSEQETSEELPDDNASVEPEGEASPTPSPSPGPSPSSTEEKGEVDSSSVFNGEEAIGQLSDEERQSLYAMVVSKLNPEQLKQMSDSLKGGLTSEELVQMETMLKSTLTEQEYSQMMELLQGSKKTDTEAILQ